jgi:hypothetical protein
MTYITKPYYKYKKDAFISLVTTVINLTKRISSFEEIVSPEAQPQDFELIIYSDGTKLGDIDIHYLSWHHLGTIRQPLFENEPLRFYTAPEFGTLPFGVVLENREQKIVEENASILLSLTKDSQEFLPNSDLRATLNHLTLTSLQETEPFVRSVRWSD